MDDVKQQLVTRLAEAKNVLVTVSRNPSIDQLAALMGLTLVLNKQKKHAVGVFSGKVPSTLEFLQPEDTIQTTTDSLRDFIISLDKSKADKLRYKVEEDVVKIYITPYKTSIAQSDFAFSEGDFNVDVVIALGVKQQEEIDQAITAHGRILHDATVATINLTNAVGLGSMNWNDETASSLCELVTELVQAIDESLIDGQIATSLLTGIVAETARFSNDKTSSHTMSASAALMSAGANQQLIATQLAASGSTDDDRVTLQGAEDENGQVAGELEIEHPAVEQAESPNPSIPPTNPVPAVPPTNSQPTTQLTEGAKIITEPPTLGGQLTANTIAEGVEPMTDPLSLGKPEDKFVNNAPQPSPSKDIETAGKTLTDIEKDVNSPHLQNQQKTLEDIEKEVNSPHLQQPPELDQARGGVSEALASDDSNAELTPKPIDALNAQTLEGNLHPEASQNVTNSDVPSTEIQGFNANVAPPVPPPLPFNSPNSPSDKQ